MATPNELLAASECFACQTPGEWQLIELALLRNILLELDPMADTNPATLLAQANCFACYASSPALMQLLQVALLNQIAGFGVVSCGSGAPTETPVGGCGVYVDTATGNLHKYYSGAWHFP